MPVITHIYIEDKNRELILDIMRDYFDSFNIQPVLGEYKGKEEPGLVIEVITHEPNQADNLSFADIAYRIKRENHQAEVFVTQGIVTLQRY